MSDNTRDVLRARSALARLHTYGKTPDPAEEADARRSLAVAKLDREIRRVQATAPAPDAVDTAHLVGLLLMWGASTDTRAEVLRRVVREAVWCTPTITDEDRAAIARDVLDGGV